MLITKRSDYAIRICRALQDGKIHSIREICEVENIPKAFASKIIRDMEMNGLVKSERGNKGGYCLKKGLNELTLHDLLITTEDDLFILHCMKEECCRNTADLPCSVHIEMARIQSLLEEELKDKTLEELLS